MLSFLSRHLFRRVQNIFDRVAFPESVSIPLKCVKYHKRYQQSYFKSSTSLGPWKFVLDMGISSYCGLIIIPGEEANGNNFGIFFFLIFYKIMVCWVYSLE